MLSLDMFSVTEERKSAVESVIDMIKTLLIEKKLKPGDAIPSENVLADSLRVSRGSVREAMKVLAAFGIIEIKRGAGTYISNSANQRIFDPLLFSILVNGSEPQELIETRDMMEKGVVGLVLRHADDAELQQLDGIMQDFSREMERSPGDREAVDSLDLRYHRFLGTITYNLIVQNIYSFIIDLFAPTIDAALGYEAHLRLHKAIMSRDEQAARDMVSGHTDAWIRAWIEKEQL